MLSLSFCSTLTPSRSRQPGTRRRDRLGVAVCQPITTPPQQPSHLSPPPTCVPLTLNLFMSFFHYVPPFEQSAFITFNYPPCHRSPCYTLDCLTHPTNQSILQPQFTLLQLWPKFLHLQPVVSSHFSSLGSPESPQPKLLLR